MQHTTAIALVLALGAGGALAQGSTRDQVRSEGRSAPIQASEPNDAPAMPGGRIDSTRSRDAVRSEGKAAAAKSGARSGQESEQAMGADAGPSGSRSKKEVRQEGRATKPDVVEGGAAR